MQLCKYSPPCMKMQFQMHQMAITLCDLGYFNSSYRCHVTQCCNSAPNNIFCDIPIAVLFLLFQATKYFVLFDRWSRHRTWRTRAPFKSKTLDRWERGYLWKLFCNSSSVLPKQSINFNRIIPTKYASFQQQPWRELLWLRMERNIRKEYVRNRIEVKWLYYILCWKIS